MGCRIIEGRDCSGKDCAVLYCSTTGIAFGPVFDDAAEADDFCDWLDADTSLWARVSPRKNSSGKMMPARRSSDPRRYPVPELMDLYAKFRETRGADGN